MMDDETAERIEAEYGMPPGRLMYHFYVEEEMSSGEIADEMDESRHTVKHWLQQAGIKMRSRTLTDIQRILIIVCLASGMGDAATGRKVGCGRSTVRRYRKDLESTGEPVDLSLGLEPRDRDLIFNLVTTVVTDPDCPEPLSELPTEG